MKRPIFVFASLLANATAIFSLSAADVVGDWKSADAAMVESKVVITTSEGAAGDLKEETGGSLKIEKDPGAPGGQAVVFDGSPNQRLISTKSIPWSEGQPFQIDLAFKPMPSDGQNGHVWLVRLYCNFAITIDPSGSTASLGLWLSNGGKAGLCQKIHMEEWNTVQAKFKDGMLELTVNGETATKALPEGATLKNATNVLTFGGGFKGSFGSLKVVADP